MHITALGNFPAVLLVPIVQCCFLHVARMISIRLCNTIKSDLVLVRQSMKHVQSVGSVAFPSYVGRKRMNVNATFVRRRNVYERKVVFVSHVNTRPIKWMLVRTLVVFVKKLFLIRGQFSCASGEDLFDGTHANKS